MNYTKGKWKLEEDGVILASDGKQIASVFPRDRRDNAHLIAAAPEMYEALRRFMPNKDDPLAQPPFRGMWEVTGEALEQARLALAKAEGK